jgi:hypothetical protein
MPRILFGLLLGGPLVLLSCGAVLAQSPAAVLGTWTGKVAQNKGESGYTVVMTISASSAETEYPDLKCGGRLTLVGAANGYVFFTEKITHGGHDTGGDCIDGTITIAPAADKLIWGWIGGYHNDTYAAWGRLRRR